MNRKIILGLAALVIVFIALGLLSEREPEPQENETENIETNTSLPKILFTSNRDTGNRRKEIYRMNSDGSDVTRITDSVYHHFLVGSEKTGRYLVTTRADADTASPSGLGDEDRKSVWIIDLETSDEWKLTGELDNAEGDGFSADGEWVVFWMISERESTSDIFKIRIDGTELTQLTDTPDVNEFDPQWSSNGDEIAYNAYSVSRPRFVLNLMDSDGGNQRTIYDGEDTVSTSIFPPGVFDPSWSPDDEWIVFEKPTHFDEENGGAGIWHIFKIRPDGTGLVDLSEAGGHSDWAEYLPSFSNDGEYIVFTGRVGSSDPSETRVDVYVMDKDGGSLQMLTDTPALDDAAVWQR